MAKYARKKDIESIKYMLTMSLVGYYHVDYSETEIDGKPDYNIDLRAIPGKDFPASNLLAYCLTHIRSSYKNIGYTLS